MAKTFIEFILEDRPNNTTMLIGQPALMFDNDFLEDVITSLNIHVSLGDTGPLTEFVSQILLSHIQYRHGKTLKDLMKENK
jgi:hypothetical protein